MENKFPKLKALMEEKRAVRERKEQQAKTTSSVQQHKQAAPVVDRDRLQRWVAMQATRMKPRQQSAETTNELDNWGFDTRHGTKASR